ncbi:OmpA family protein [Marinivivus vitaminiproducens]|uniref:OmpA family protein n=1 Tax=Marinivivus vitaminiproducens TaxID=3035935 RepID=UPI0027A8BB9E|nr:OmpA family protein [Geminicoccaceae bacterium SCSIO 64248]
MRNLALGVSLLALAAPSAFAQGTMGTGSTMETGTPMSTESMTAGAADYTVFFNFDQSTLTPEGRQVVSDAAASYQRTGEAAISIAGHADSAGSAEYNQRLSERRAAAVQDALIDAGVPASSIGTVTGVGESDPLVATADGVPEARNRRVVIAIPQAAPEPAPVAVAPMEPVEEDTDPFQFTVGGLYGYNMQDENDDNKSSHLAGLNLGLDYGLGSIMSLSLEQAGFYNLYSEDEGFGGRSAAGVDFNLGFENVIPTVGGNIGYIYGSGINDDFFAGPEIGLSLPFFDVKVAYDMPFNRGIENGIVMATVGTGIRF